MAYSRFNANEWDWTYALYQLDTGAGQGNCAAANRCSDLGAYAFYSPQFSYLAVFSSVGGGNYHGAQLSVRKRFAGGDSVDLNYTFSKSMDLRSNTERVGSSTGVIWNPWQPGLMKGVSDYDNKHYLSGVNRALDAIVGGWQLAGAWRVSSTGVWPTNWNNNNWALWNGQQLQGRTEPVPRSEVGSGRVRSGNAGRHRHPQRHPRRRRVQHRREPGQALPDAVQRAALAAIPLGGVNEGRSTQFPISREFGN
jgi:hypothetical protein